MACSHHGKEDNVSVLVETTALQYKALSITVSGYGVVMANATDAANIILTTPGQVKTLPIAAGQMVSKDEVIATVTTDPNARLAYQQAVTALVYAKDEVKRTQQLLQEKLATKSQLAAAQQALQNAQTNIDAEVRKGSNNIVQTITAPFAGVVLAVNVAIGDQVQGGVTLLQLAHENKLAVQLGIEPSESQLIKPGMLVKLAPLNIKTKPIFATVDKVYAILDPQTQLVNVYVKLSEQQKTVLLPGMHVHGIILIQSQKLWTVPRSAVLKDAHGAYIYQVKDNRAIKIYVKKIIEEKNDVGIQGQLLLNAPVVTVGNYELQNGMAVRE